MPRLSPSADRPANSAETVAKAALRAAEHLDVAQSTLARIIGLSEASVSRLSQGHYKLDLAGKPFELALLFIRLFRSLDAIVGGDEATARAWLRGDNLALGGRPLDLITRVSGLIDVIAYLDSRRALV
ncbi:MbcA/ParS/Xre antitoxin family protein [Terrarubrum flagellatum]|uniref:MbcA/ParS/Xre antitoxin family protein n=1 Tax=Terrirubrum flagellatum TaxID=2895980 RepID=UPI0031452538